MGLRKNRLARRWSTVVLVSFVLWMAFEYFALRGDVIIDRRIDINEEANVTFQVTKPGEPHLAQIRPSSEHAVAFELYDPNDDEIHRFQDEYRVAPPRIFEFTPSAAGEYLISVRRNEQQKYASVVPARLTVLVNDRRFLTLLVLRLDSGDFF